MASTERRSSLANRYLDPATSLAEIMFGLIMTLTFTLGAGIIIQDEGREGARQLLIAVIGCNVAWGIIDGALYVMNELFGRGRIRRLTQAVQASRNDQDAVTVVAGELDGLFEEISEHPEREALYLRIATHLRSRSPDSVGIEKADVMAPSPASGW
jgi:hypothetical protein